MYAKIALFQLFHSGELNKTRKLCSLR